MAFAVAILTTSRILETNILDVKISDSSEKVNDVASVISYDFLNNNADSMYSYILKKAEDLNGRILVINSRGVVQLDSSSRLNGYKINNREVIEILNEETDISYGYHQIDDHGETFWALNTTSAIINDGKTVGVVLFSQSIQEIVNNIDSTRGSYYIIYIVVTIVLLALFYLLIQQILQPLNKLKKTTEYISNGDLSKRVDIRGRDELAQLGKSFNEMAARLEDVDRTRSEFVSNASHELKTPLTSMKILTESILYEEGVDEATYKEFLTDIDKEIDRMTSLINDLLLLTKIQNLDEIGNLMEKVNIHTMVNDLVTSVRTIAEQKWIQVTSNVNYYGEVDAIPSYFKQAISNLVVNAIKYTQDNGHVEINVSKSGSEVYISVKDNGEGISEENQRKIFERFYRVSKSRSRETGGSGLGLHIVQMVAKLHHGRVELVSEEGKGSEFTFVIPVNYYERRERNDKKD